MTASENIKNRLSIQFALDGFSFVIFNPKRNRILKEKEVLYSGEGLFHNWLKVKLAGEATFKESYEHINLLYAPEKYTLVPEKLMQQEKEKQLFELTFSLEETEMIQKESVDTNVLLSSISCDSYNLFNDYFPKAKWKTVPKLLAESIQEKKKWNIGVLIRYTKLYITVTKENKVQLSNSFQFQTKDDLIYYLLYTFDNLEIPVAKSSIQLWGNQDYLPILQEELSRYHPHITLSKSPVGISTKKPMGNLLLSNL